MEFGMTKKEETRLYNAKYWRENKERLTEYNKMRRKKIRNKRDKELEEKKETSGTEQLQTNHCIKMAVQALKEG